MKFIDDLRKKPEREKLIILWSILIPIGLILSIIWMYNSSKAIDKFGQEDLSQGIDISKLEEEMPDTEFEIPDIPEGISEEELEEILNNATQ